MLSSCPFARFNRIPLPRPELQVQLIPVFELLFIQHGGALREYFKQIPFMPEKPDAIKNITAQFEAMTSNSRTDLATRLATFTEILKHENPSVRSMALDKLLAVLRSKREQIRRMALLGEEVDPSIKQLVEVVLQGCRDPDRGARVKFGAILGELGAIDPARLRPAVMDSRSANNAQVEVKSTRSDSNLGSSAVLAATLDKSESDLAHDLISTCLIRAFRSANDLRTQDSAAYAIQELMKLQHCGPKVLTYKSPSALQPKEAAAFAFWHSFAPEEQLIVTPLLSSKYRSVGTPPAVSSAKPIYNEKVRHPIIVTLFHA
jgi:serine/threonine-protein kinase ATR